MTPVRRLGNESPTPTSPLLRYLGISPIPEASPTLTLLRKHVTKTGGNISEDRIPIKKHPRRFPRQEHKNDLDDNAVPLKISVRRKPKLAKHVFRPIFPQNPPTLKTSMRRKLNLAKHSFKMTFVQDPLRLKIVQGQRSPKRSYVPKQRIKFHLTHSPRFKLVSQRHSLIRLHTAKPHKMPSVDILEYNVQKLDSLDASTRRQMIRVLDRLKRRYGLIRPVNTHKHSLVRADLSLRRLADIKLARGLLKTRIRKTGASVNTRIRRSGSAKRDTKTEIVPGESRQARAIEVLLGALESSLKPQNPVRSSSRLARRNTNLSALISPPDNLSISSSKHSTPNSNQSNHDTVKTDDSQYSDLNALAVISGRKTSTISPRRRRTFEHSGLRADTSSSELFARRRLFSTSSRAYQGQVKVSRRRHTTKLQFRGVTWHIAARETQFRLKKMTVSNQHPYMWTKSANLQVRQATEPNTGPLRYVRYHPSQREQTRKPLRPFKNIPRTRRGLKLLRTEKNIAVRLVIEKRAPLVKIGSAVFPPKDLVKVGRAKLTKPRLSWVRRARRRLPREAILPLLNSSPQPSSLEGDLGHAQHYIDDLLTKDFGVVSPKSLEKQGQ
jgi:hypothetical protein